MPKTKKNSPGKIKSELCTVLMVDIVGYSHRSANLTKEKFSELHDAFDSISKDLFSSHRGKVFNKSGDAYLTKFPTASDALLCAIKLQINFQKYSRFKDELSKIPIRVAIHSGEVIDRDNNLFGDTVNTVARIESITKSGDIVISETLFHSTSGNNIPFRYIGKKKMKGLKYPINLFCVKKPYQKILNPSHLFLSDFKKVKSLAIPALFFVIFVVVLIFTLAIILRIFLNFIIL
jgi:adenylate cyclase